MQALLLKKGGIRLLLKSHIVGELLETMHTCLHNPV